MSNEQKLIDLGAHSVAGVLVLNNVKVGHFADGDFHITAEGTEALTADVPAKTAGKPVTASAAKTSGKPTVKSASTDDDLDRLLAE